MCMSMNNLYTIFVALVSHIIVTVPESVITSESQKNSSQSITNAREETYPLPKQQPFAFTQLDSSYTFLYNVVSILTTYL
jgi:hypothetical protein